MKEKELRKHAACSICGKKVCAAGAPLFWRITVERFGIDLNAVKRQTGLAMMLGGNAVIAAAMGPDEDMARVMMDPVTITVCEPCSTSQAHLICRLPEFEVPAEEMSRDL